MRKDDRRKKKKAARGSIYQTKKPRWSKPILLGNREKRIRQRKVELHASKKKKIRERTRDLRENLLGLNRRERGGKDIGCTFFQQFKKKMRKAFIKSKMKVDLKARAS